MTTWFIKTPVEFARDMGKIVGPPPDCLERERSEEDKKRAVVLAQSLMRDLGYTEGFDLFLLIMGREQR
jgi:hypothetical protein